MLSVSIAQLRAHASRLVATALAILIAVGFLVATLALNETSRNTVLNAVAAQFRGSAVVVSPDPEAGGVIQDPAALLAAVRRVPGVATATVDLAGSAQVRLPGRSGYHYAQVTSTSPAGPLAWQPLTAGRLPAGPGEIAIGDQRGLAVGQRVRMLVGTGDGDPVPATATVTGLVDLRGTAAGTSTQQLFATADQVRAWSTADPRALRIAAAPGTDDGELAGRVRGAVTQAGLDVRTGTEQAEVTAKAYTGGTAGITPVLLVFATVAVVVCGLVIANTFTVLLAQRTRELALLRVVGTTSRQLRRGVLFESFVIGALASAAGVAAGIGVAAGVSAAVQRSGSPIPLSDFGVPLDAVGIGMAVGVVMTVLAALAPAVRATRVSPLSALRPMDAAPLRSRKGLLRLAFGLLLALPGAALLAAGAAGGLLLVALPGGVLSFLGVVLLARWVVPPVVALAGRGLGRVGGVPGELASSNAGRNPLRVAATATALIIGVTLTTTMVVGAASTRTSAASLLDQQFPTDVQIVPTTERPLPAGVDTRVAGVPGVAAAVALPGQDLTVGDLETQVLGFDPVRTRGVVRSAEGAGVPTPGTISVPAAMKDSFGAEGTRVVVRGGGRSLPLRVHLVDTEPGPLGVTTADLARLAPAAAVRQVWVRLDDGLAGGDDADGRNRVVDAITDAAADLAPASSVTAASAERDAFDKLVNTLLLMVTALLAVAVLIALIGVGNTLALSVLERRQESGLLRALGLTRSQLRRTLLWEALLIAGVSAVLGVGLGIVYGATGTMAALSGQGAVTVSVPWGQVAGIVLVATLAGALASVLPGRRAARISPVAAIATA